MGVVSAALHFRGTTGSCQSMPGRAPQPTYSAVYLVTTSSPTVSVAEIVEYFRGASGVPHPGDYFNFAGVSDRNAILRAIHPERASGSATAWYVTLEYRPADEGSDGNKGGGEQRNDPSGNLTGDPLQWATQISCGESWLSQPVRKAKYLGGFKGFAHQQMQRFAQANAWIVPQNSNGQPFNPQLEKLVRIGSFRIGCTFTDHDGTALDRFRGKINNQKINIVWARPYQFRETWDKHTIRIAGLTDVWKWNTADQFFWERTLDVQHNPETWNDEVLDQGREVRDAPQAGDDDGKGGSWSMADYQYYVTNAWPHVRRVTDSTGNPVADPILLDGDGRANKPGRDPVYVTWQKYEDVELGAFINSFRRGSL